jgi:hypothetical protein
MEDRVGIALLVMSRTFRPDWLILAFLAAVIVSTIGRRSAQDLFAVA